MDKRSEGSESSNILFHERRRHKAPQEMELLRKEAYEAFMRHPAVTAEEFERLWPSIRDELLIKFVVDQLLTSGG